MRLGLWNLNSQSMFESIILNFIIRSMVDSLIAKPNKSMNIGQDFEWETYEVTQRLSVWLWNFISQYTVDILIVKPYKLVNGWEFECET